MLNIYEERAMERGIERGKRGTVLRQLQRKFGELPTSVVARIEQMEDPDELDTLLDRLMDAGTLAEIGL